MFQNLGASTTYATGDYTVVVMFQKQPYFPGSNPYILGYDDVSDDHSGSRLEGGHFTNGGGGDSQEFTWSANSPTACDSGGPASPDMNWYIFGAYKAPGDHSIVSTFLTTVGSLADISTGALAAGAFGNMGDEVRLGGQHNNFVNQGMHGYIWKAMAWTGQPSRLEIYAWAKHQAGL